VQVTRLGYRTWARKALRPPLVRWWPIARIGVRSVLARRVFWFFLLLGLIHFLFTFAKVYLVAQIESGVIEGGRRVPPIIRNAIFTGTGDSYRDFILGQSVVVMLFLGFAGANLVGNDFRYGALPFYLSKPIGKAHYFAGKLAAAAGMTALITLVPAVVLFLEYWSFTNAPGYLFENWRILCAIIGCGSLVSLCSSCLILGIAAYFERTIPIVVAWGAVFLFLPAVGTILRRTAEDHAWSWDLLNFWDVLRWVSNSMFGIAPEKYELRLDSSLMVLGAWMALSMAAFWRRVVAVEVVR